MSTNSGHVRVRRSIQAVLLVLILLITFIVGSTPAARAQAPSLFGDAGPAGPSNAPAADAKFVVRSRLVSVNAGLLLGAGGNALDVAAVPEVTLNLFPDTTYTGKVTHLDTYDENTHTWSGELKEVAGGYFYLTISGGAFMAHVASTNGVYEVSLARGDLYRVIQIDQSQLKDHPDGYEIPINPIPAAPADLSAADSAARIDILVVYTDDARAAEGSTAAMMTRIATAVSESNTAYANSGVTTRLRLVHAEEVSYAETGNIFTDLAYLVNPSDGVLDNVPALRDTYGADMVSMVVESSGYCGLANAIMATAPGAYDVVRRSGCMTGYYSFSHEFGHLQGARHDMYVDSTLTPYAYGHGYVHTGSTVYNRWRTIMAYNDKCSDLGYNCTRVQYFSNDTKYYHEALLGNTARARAYSVLNTTAATVANFRHQVIAANFSSSFNTSSSGWSALIGPWALSNGAYYTSTGIANHGSSAVHGGNYGDLTYTVRMQRSGGAASLANRIILRGYPAEFDETMWWQPSYVFQYNNDGLFSVYYEDSGGALTTLAGWTASGAIVPYGWNTLKVIAVDHTLKYYINGMLVWVGSEPSLAVGAVGFGYYRDGSAGKLYVDSASLTTTPTAADILPGEVVAPAVPLSGGDLNQGP